MIGSGLSKLFKRKTSEATEPNNDLVKVISNKYEHLGIDPITIQLLINSGELPSQRTDHFEYFKLSDLDKLIDEMVIIAFRSDLTADEVLADCSLDWD